MAYDTQNRWVYGLCLFWKLALFPSSGEGRQTPGLLGPLEKVTRLADEVNPFRGI
jgi:hypothetical protein